MSALFFGRSPDTPLPGSAAKPPEFVRLLQAGMRIGEQLVAEELVTSAAVEECLEAQVVEGGRLGTILVERNYIHLDVLAEALARQHDMAAAIAKHFEGANPEIQKRLPAELAARWHTVPLGLVSRDPVQFAVAVTDPLPLDGIAELEQAMGGQIIAAVAPELRVLYHLERVYEIPRLNRFRRARKPTVDETPVGSPEEAEERERRQYIRPVSEGQVQAPNALARIAIRKIRVVSGEVEAPAEISSVEEAISAIRRATGRDSLGRAVAAGLQCSFDAPLDAAMLLVFRRGVAIGWTGFIRGGDDNLIEGIAVSLAGPSMFRSAAQTKVAFVGAPHVPSEIDTAIWAGLGCRAPSAVAVFPVLLGNKLVAAMYAHRSTPFTDTDVATFNRLAEGLSGGFLRLIRAAER